MKTKEKFEGYLIPDEHLENIQGGKYFGPLGLSICPRCGCTRIVATKTLPPVYKCWECPASWVIDDWSNEVYVIIDMRTGADVLVEKTKENYRPDE